MATGLLIRDFTKVYRELRYANEGSIRLTEIEHNAYVNRLTLEITHYDAYRSVNYRTNPDNTHWGYLTSFKGSSVLQNLPVKFAKQRVFDYVNQHIWEFHQQTESVEILSSFALSAAKIAVTKLKDESVPIPGFEKFLDLNESLEDSTNPLLKWLVGIDDSESSSFPADTDPYTAFPIASPFPDVFKFKSDVPVSFLFRLESWYLVNPLVYVLNNPSDTGDATEGEDEYPDPVGPNGEDSGPGSGGEVPFPMPDLPEAGSDPDDYGDFGVDAPVLIRITYTLNAWQAGCVPYTDTREIVVPYERSLDYSLDTIGTTNTSTCQENPAPVGLRLISPRGNVIQLEAAGTEMRGASTIDNYELVDQS